MVHVLLVLLKCNVSGKAGRRNDDRIDIVMALKLCLDRRVTRTLFSRAWVRDFDEIVNILREVRRVRGARTHFDPSGRF